MLALCQGQFITARTATKEEPRQAGQSPLALPHRRPQERRPPLRPRTDHQQRRRQGPARQDPRLGQHPRTHHLRPRPHQRHHASGLPRRQLTTATPKRAVPPRPRERTAPPRRHSTAARKTRGRMRTTPPTPIPLSSTPWRPVAVATAGVGGSRRTSCPDARSGAGPGMDRRRPGAGSDQFGHVEVRQGELELSDLHDAHPGLLHQVGAQTHGRVCRVGHRLGRVVARGDATCVPAPGRSSGWRCRSHRAAPRAA